MATRKELMRVARESAKKERNRVFEIEQELREKMKKEEDAKRDIARKEQEKQDEIERKKRHEKWLERGEVYQKKMIAREEKQLAAKAFIEYQKKREEEAKKAEKAKRLEEQRRVWKLEQERQDAEKAERERRTRWYDSGAKYVGSYAEEPTWAKRKAAWTNRHRTPHGQGKWFLPNDIVQYDGGWRMGKMHGRGRFFWYNGSEAGSTYEGEFKNNRKHGYGVYQRAGERNGKACIYFNDRRVAWYDDLKQEGVRIRLLHTNYNGSTEWYWGTIWRYDEYRPKHKHLVKFDHDEPTAERWVDLTRQEFQCNADPQLLPDSESTLPPLSYRLIKPSSETIGCVSSDAADGKTTDPLYNRPKFKSKTVKYYLPNVTPRQLRYERDAEIAVVEDTPAETNGRPYSLMEPWLIVDKQLDCVPTDEKTQGTGHSVFALMDKLKPKIESVLASP
jgi:hypothetical protein